MELIQSWATIKDMEPKPITLSEKLIEAAGGRWYYPVLSLFAGAGVAGLWLTAIILAGV